MNKAGNYFEKDFTLEIGVNELSNVNLDYNKNRDDINILIYNTILQYITSYLQIESKSIEKIKNDIETIMKSLAKGKQFESGINGMISENNEFGNNHYSIGCLLDIQQTSAIIKEIIFGKYEDINNGIFKSVDLGSGTGILSLGALISAKRNGHNKGELNLYDLSQISIDNSKRVLEEIDNKFKVNGNYGNVFKKDLLSIGTPNMWISETISDMTPSFGYDIDDNEIIKYSDDTIIPFNLAGINMGDSIITQELIDPYPELFEKSMKEIPNFIENIKSSKTFMFPDYLNKKYIPDGENSTIKFETFSDGGELSLGETRKEYKKFPKIYSKDSRWQDKDERKKMFDLFKSSF